MTVAAVRRSSYICHVCQEMLRWCPLWLSNLRHGVSTGRWVGLRCPLRRSQDGPQVSRSMSALVRVGMVVSDTLLDLSRALALMLTLMPVGMTPEMPSRTRGGMTPQMPSRTGVGVTPQTPSWTRVRMRPQMPSWHRLLCS